jgi:predicted aldo/keto reductase-like oxidoreductase
MTHLLPPQLTAPFGPLGPVCRLGLATRYDCILTEDDIGHAVQAGVNFLNWPGSADVLSRFVAALGPRRRDVFVCSQFEARTAADARAELERQLADLKSDYVDLLTFYYVEEEAEWRQLTAADGALTYCRAAQRDGRVRLLGVTTHQRPLAAAMLESGQLDALMIRYNAAHRGAETELFPLTQPRGVPVVAYTALRWGGLLRPTPDDPPGFAVPRAPDWYRFVLHHPAVTVALAAPHDRAELDEDLTVLRAAPPSAAEYAALAPHGQRVRQHAGQFP